MTLFAIYYRSGDACGNTNEYFVGYLEAPSREAAEAEFRRGVFECCVAREVVPSTAQELRDLIARKTEPKTPREWL